MRLIDSSFIVAGLLLQGLKQPHVVLILRRGRPLRGIFDVLQVAAHVRRYLLGLDCSQGTIPTWGVVRSALPGMVDRHQPRLFRIPIGGQITVPGQKRWVYIFQEGSREGGDGYLIRCAFVPASDFPDAPGSDSVDRRLAKPTGMNRSGG